MTARLNPYFQVGVDVMDQPCLVIGGSRGGEGSSSRLLDAGARLTVVSPSLTPTLQSWRDEGRLTHLSRAFREDDLRGMFVVINTVEGDDQLAGEVYGIALRDRILVNSFDRPDLSNIGMPALVDPGHLRLAISTSTARPGLARRLREDLEHLFDEEFVRYLSQLGRVRAHLKKVAAGDDGRFEILHSLVADFRLNGSIDYPAGWRQRVADLFSRRTPSESETGSAR